MAKSKHTRHNRFDACNNVYSDKPVSMDLRNTTFYSIESNGTVLDVTPNRNTVTQFVEKLQRKGTNPQVYMVTAGKKIRIRWQGEKR